MRSRLAILTLLIVGVPCSKGGPLTLCTKKQVVHLNEKINGSVYDFTNNHKVDRRFYSEALGCKRDMYVYLPPGFDEKLRYPLMIWMHGFIQDEKDFLDLAPIFDKAIACGRLPPMIIAAPDGSIRGRPTFFNMGSFYLNSKAGRFEDYIAVDVWNFLVTNFPIRPEPEAHILAGGSMGGYGAYNLGIKYRKRFKIVAGFLPPLNTRYLDCRGRYYADFDPNCIGWMEKYRPHASIGSFYGVIHIPQYLVVDPLFGRNREEALQAIARENPVEMLESYDVKPSDLSMFIGYGGKDEFNIDAQVESFLWFAKKRGIEPYVVLDPKGRHRSETGIKMMPEFAAWLTPLIKDYAPPPCSK
jgi:S-formylglutathione hydrolase FrmB